MEKLLATFRKKFLQKTLVNLHRVRQAHGLPKNQSNEDFSAIQKALHFYEISPYGKLNDICRAQIYNLRSK